MNSDQAVPRRRGLISRVPFHVALLPTCFVLAAYARNRFEADLTGVVEVLLGVVAGAMSLMALLRPVFGSWARAGAATSYISAYLLYEPTVFYGIEPSNSLSLASFGMATLLLLLMLVRLLRSRMNLANLTLVLNVVVLAAPVTDLWILASWYAAGGGSAVAATDVFPELPAPLAGGASDPNRPDIWYLVPDRYTNEAILLNRHRFDNAEFIDTLRSNGFTVVDNAHSNYQRTAVSLASVLNLDYLAGFGRFPDIDGRDWHPVYDALTDNRVSRFLHQAGYRIYRFGPYWEPTRRDPYADEHHNVFDMPEIAQRVLTVTVPGQLAYATGLGAIDGWYSHCQRLQRQFAGLIDLAGRDGPKYVMAHLLVTHPPFVMTEDGRCLSQPEANARLPVQSYIDSVKYANTQFKQLIDAILKGPRPAIIVLMADEGPWPSGIKLLRPGTFASSEMVDWSAMTAAQLDLKTGILMAIHLPEREAGEISVNDAFPRSPVNVFRMILRRYFQLDLPPLPDRYYVYHSDELIYDFIDVTDRLPR